VKTQRAQVGIGALCAALWVSLSFAHPVTFGWLPNPPEDNVTEYCMYTQEPNIDGGLPVTWTEPRLEWCGPGTFREPWLTHALDLDPSHYRVTATARGAWHTEETPHESEPSKPVILMGPDLLPTKTLELCVIPPDGPK